MFCPNCGKPNDNNAAFCAECGTRLTPQTVQPQASAPIQPQAPAPVEPHVKPSQESKTTSETKKPQTPQKKASKPAEEPTKPAPKQEPIEAVKDEAEKTTDDLTESERKTSKKLMPVVVVVLILLLGGGAYLGHQMDWWQIPFLKNSYSSSEPLDFIQLEGSETQQSEGLEIGFEYSIAWPVGTNEQIVSILQNWVIEQVSGNASTEDRDIDAIIRQAANHFFEGDESYSKHITITAEKNYPFESLLTMKSESWVFRSFEYGDICINLENGQVFDGNNAISDTEAMRHLIVKNLQEQFAKDNSNWGSQISYYTPENLPMPKLAPVLTPDGVKFLYAWYEISSGAAGEFSCCIPYDDAVPALTEQAKAFLPISIIKSAEIKAQEKDAAKDEAIKFFYQTYYNDEIIKTNDGQVGSQGYGYSESIKNKFRELGITSELDYPVLAELKEGNGLYKPYYTQDLNNLLKKYYQKVNEDPDNFELMLMVYGEFDGGSPFDLEIKGIEVLSPSKIILKVAEIDCYDMDVVLVKEDGKWYIDDISGYRQREQYILN